MHLESKKIKDIEGKDVKLIANKISKMRVYVWIDGQDPDCINWASHSDGIDVNIGLVKAGAGKVLLENQITLATEDITTSSANVWYQYRDGTTPIVSNGEITLEVGTQVSGYEVTVEDETWGDGDWYILGAENGKLLLTTNKNVTILDTVSYDISYLDSIVENYRDIIYSENIRTINVDDINRVTGYNPNAIGDGTEGKYDEGKISEYGHQVIYRVDSSTGKIWCKGTKYYTTDTLWDGWFLGYYIGEDDLKWLHEKGKSIILTSNGYEYYPHSLKRGSSKMINGISLDSLAFLMLFADTSGEKKGYWLGSIYTYIYSCSYIEYGLRIVNDRKLECWGIQDANSLPFDYVDFEGLGVRPTVTLKPDVKIDSKGHLSI